jgi:mevalonate kinase
MAIDLYSTVEARTTDGTGIEVNVDIPVKFLAGPERTALADSGELLQPLRIAAEATLSRIRMKRTGVSVNVSCRIPIGAGLGSSASTTVAIISAVSKSQGISLDRRDIFQLAFVPERFLHGKPSG